MLLCLVRNIPRSPIPVAGRFVVSHLIWWVFIVAANEIRSSDATHGSVDLNANIRLAAHLPCRPQIPVVRSY